MLNLGTVRPGTTILVPFNAFDSNDPSASVIISAFVLADIGIYKALSMTERASTTGVVLLDTDGINIDGATGIHGFSIDLSSNATADFYTAGSRYYVTVGPITIDAATVNFVAATFEIGYPDAIINTTIATLASQTSFTLTLASLEAGTYIGWKAIVHDIASAVQICVGYVSAYAVTTKTVTLAVDPGIFTMAAGDNISLFPPDNVQAWRGTAVSAATAGTPDVNTVAIFNNILPALMLERWLNEGKTSTADSGTTTTLVDTSLSEADDHWNGALLVFTGGTNNGYTAIATDFDAATDTLTFTPAVPANVTTETYILIPGLGWAMMADAGLENTKTNWDRALTGATHNIATSAGKRLRQIDAAFEVHSGTAQTGSTSTTIKLDTGASTVDNIYRGDRVIIVGGTGAEEHGIIVSYVGSSRVATMAETWVVTPTDDSEFVIVPASVDVETVQHTIQTAGDLAALITTVDGVVDAIKAVTDKMVFTNTNELDANTKSINDAEVVGDGNATPWDGA